MSEATRSSDQAQQGYPHVSNLIALDEALAELAAVDPQAAELVQLRYFTGLTISQAAEALGISPRSADRAWAYARAWLFRRISGEKIRRYHPCRDVNQTRSRKHEGRKARKSRRLGFMAFSFVFFDLSCFRDRLPKNWRDRGVDYAKWGEPVFRGAS